MNDAGKSVDRETLYNEVWTDPVSVVAGRYGLSDVGLAKICRSLAIPLPSRGYWAKVKAGKTMGRAPLPKLEQPGAVATRLVKLAPEEVASRAQAREANARIRKDIENVPLKAEGVALHPLVRAASKRLRQRDGWPDGILARSAPKEVLNLSVTKVSLDRALEITDLLIHALLKQGFDVEIDRDKGVTHLKWIQTGTCLEFSLSEHVKRSNHQITPAEERAQKRYWERSRWDSSMSYPHVPRYDYTPTGMLTIHVGRWPSKSWKDTPRTRLEDRLGEVVAGTLALAREVHVKAQEEVRRQEAHRCAVARYEFLVKRRAEEAARFEELEKQA